MTLRTLNYGNYGIFLTMGNAGFCPSTVSAALGGFTRAAVVVGLMQPRQIHGLLHDVPCCAQNDAGRGTYVGGSWDLVAV